MMGERDLARRLRNLYETDASGTWLAEARERVGIRVRPERALAAARTPQRVRWPRVALATGLLLVAGTTVVLAAGAITDLGKPRAVTSSNAYFPLSGFSHYGSPLRAHSRTELLVIDTEMPVDARSAIERWPVIQALDQFGTFSDVTAAPQTCTQSPVGTSCGDPTFDWSKAEYRSAWVEFVHRDLLDAKGHVFQGLSRTEDALYNRFTRYVPPKSFKGDRYDAAYTVGQMEDHPRGFPLVAVGGYVETQSQDIHPLDFELSTCTTVSGTTQTCNSSGLTFDHVRKILLQGKVIPGSVLLQDVNGEANIITALICRSDGKRPAKVCNRPVIRAILRSVH